MSESYYFVNNNDTHQMTTYYAKDYLRAYCYHSRRVFPNSKEYLQKEVKDTKGCFVSWCEK